MLGEAYHIQSLSWSSKLDRAGVERIVLLVIGGANGEPVSYSSKSKEESRSKHVGQVLKRKGDQTLGWRCHLADVS
jgi:hypothetical protein